MLCQRCQERTANVHFTKITNDVKVEMHLCEQCANESGQVNIGMPMGLAGFLSGIMNHDINAVNIPSINEVKTCEGCGMSFEGFQKCGKLGCEKCYTLYKDRLNPIIRRLHGSVRHSGKVPAGIAKDIKVSKEISRLKGLLNKAIKNEEYEKAAELRDRIKAIEAAED